MQKRSTRHAHSPLYCTCFHQHRREAGPIRRSDGTSRRPVHGVSKRECFPNPPEYESLTPTVMDPPFCSTPAKSVLIEALHHSRRRDAARVIHRYRHLIAADAESELPVRLAATAASTRAHRAKNQQEKGEFRMLRANGLMVLVLLGFGIAHVVGAILLLRTTNPQARQAAVVTHQGD
jgi:hypothetical protein